MSEGAGMAGARERLCVCVSGLARGKGEGNEDGRHGEDDQVEVSSVAVPMRQVEEVQV